MRNNRKIFAAVSSKFDKKRFTPTEVGLLNWLVKKYGEDVVLETIEEIVLFKKIENPIFYLRICIKNKFLLEDVDGILNEY